MVLSGATGSNADTNNDNSDLEGIADALASTFYLQATDLNTSVNDGTLYIKKEYDVYSKSPTAGLGSSNSGIGSIIYTRPKAYEITGDAFDPLATERLEIACRHASINIFKLEKGDYMVKILPIRALNAAAFAEEIKEEKFSKPYSDEFIISREPYSIEQVKKFLSSYLSVRIPILKE